jgi:hypothetical protein
MGLDQHLREPNGHLERVATWGTQSTGQNTNNRKHNTIQKTKKISSTESTTKNNAVNPGVLSGNIR